LDRIDLQLIKQVLFGIINETRNLSGDEIANVNFLYDDTVHVFIGVILGGYEGYAYPPTF